MSINIKSNKASLDWSQIEKDAATHIARVVADGGTVNDSNVVLELIANLYASNVDRTRVWFYGDKDSGVKLSGANVSKWYSVLGASGDMTPTLSTGTVTAGTSGGRTNCIICAGDAQISTISRGLVSPETTILSESRATNAALRQTMAIVDNATTLSGPSGPGIIQAGNTVGYRQNGYTSAGGTNVDYATYVDFQRMGYVTRHADTGEIFVDGVSVANRGVQLAVSPTYSLHYFRIGGLTSAVAVSRAFAFGGVLRPAQMKAL